MAQVLVRAHAYCPRCKRPTRRAGGHPSVQGCLQTAGRSAVRRLWPLRAQMAPARRRVVLACWRKRVLSRRDLARLAALLDEYFEDGTLSAELAGQQWLL